jgi:hypothetical protein
MSLAESNRSIQKLPVHGGVDTISGDQFLMCAPLDDASTSSTSTPSALRTVLNRWAMTKLVRSRKSSCRARWILASVRLSTALVASSRMRILGLASIARAMQTNCRWPAEIPPSLFEDNRVEADLLDFLAATEALGYGKYLISGSFWSGWVRRMLSSTVPVKRKFC